VGLSFNLSQASNLELRSWNLGLEGELRAEAAKWGIKEFELELAEVGEQGLGELLLVEGRRNWAGSGRGGAGRCTHSHTLTHTLTHTPTPTLTLTLTLKLTLTLTPTCPLTRSRPRPPPPPRPTVWRRRGPRAPGLQPLQCPPGLEEAFAEGAPHPLGQQQHQRGQREGLAGR